MKIIGAGLSGCIAGLIFGDAEILEKNKGMRTNHQGLLRFRSNRLSELTGIPFKKIEITKSIWDGENFSQPNPKLVNLYSQKVTGHIIDRSISNIDPGVRYIAPQDFHEQLQYQLRNRLHYGCDINMGDIGMDPVISTIPLGTTLSQLAGYEDIVPELVHSKIHITKYIIPDCDIYQTIYFPMNSTLVYRASLTGEMLIIESLHNPTPMEIDNILCLFGINCWVDEPVYSGNQSFGKIVPLDDTKRKRLLYHLSHNNNIWSLGRYACWRNILLDDVLEDAYHIRRMINQEIYDIRKGIE